MVQLFSNNVQNTCIKTSHFLPTVNIHENYYIDLFKKRCYAYFIAILIRSSLHHPIFKFTKEIAQNILRPLCEGLLTTMYYQMELTYFYMKISIYQTFIYISIIIFMCFDSFLLQFIINISIIHVLFFTINIKPQVFDIVKDSNLLYILY